VFYKDVYAGAEAIRAISQSGLFPSNVRLLDPEEARVNGFGDGQRAVMVLAFESADHPLEAWMARALGIARGLGGEYDEDAAKNADAHKEGAAGAWRNAFIRMPYNREIVTRAAILNDTSRGHRRGCGLIPELINHDAGAKRAIWLRAVPSCATRSDDGERAIAGSPRCWTRSDGAYVTSTASRAIRRSVCNAKLRAFEASSAEWTT
jgi:hypothetical protein